MASDVLRSLPELRAQSGKHLPGVFRDILQDTNRPRALVTQQLVANGSFVTQPRHGISSLHNPENRQSVRRTRTFCPGDELGVLKRLNDSLLGGESYPVLTAILGTAAGALSGGASLLFTIGTTGLGMAQSTQRVLARIGDQVFHVEEIGKERHKGKDQIVYVSSFFIVDPYRVSAPQKGWLIHEERETIS